MATMQEAFEAAVRLHQAGRLQEAEQLYRQFWNSIQRSR